MKYLPLYEEFKRSDIDLYANFQKISSQSIKNGSIINSEKDFIIVKILNNDAFDYWTRNKFINISTQIHGKYFSTKDLFNYYDPKEWDCFVFYPLDFVVFIQRDTEFYDGYTYKNSIKKLVQKEVEAQWRFFGIDFPKRITKIDPETIEKNIQEFTLNVKRTGTFYTFRTYEYERCVYPGSTLNIENALIYNVDSKNNLYTSTISFKSFLNGALPKFKIIGNSKDAKNIINNLEKIQLEIVKLKLNPSQINKSTNTYFFDSNLDLSNSFLVSIDFGFNIEFLEPNKNKFDVSNNYLKNLIGAPLNVEPKNFNYSKNPNLTQSAIDDYWRNRIKKDLTIIGKLKAINKLSDTLKKEFEELHNADEFGFFDN